MTVHYTEGSARAVIRGETVVVLPGAKVDDTLLRALWTELGDASDGVAAALGVLTSREGGLRAVPPFAVVSVQRSGSAHVAVRGAGLDVTVATAGGPVPVSGQDVVSWSERVIEEPTSFVVSVADGTAPASGSGDGFPVESAVVAAGSVRRVLVEGADDAGPAAAPGGTLGEFATFGSTPAAEDVPPVPAPPVAGRHTDAPSGAAAPEPAGPAFGAAGATALPGPASSGSPVPETTQIGGGDDEYEHLFGETIMRSVEDAAVRAPEEDEEDEPAAKEPGKPAAAVPPPPAPGPPAPPAADEAPGLISAVPGGFPGPSPAAPGGTPAAAHRAASIGAEASAQETIAPTGDEPDDHDGHTVMQSDLADLRRAGGLGQAAPGAGGTPAPGTGGTPAPTASAAGTGPEILAVTCPNGHANPPSRPTCRTCGDDLSGEPAPAPRPALGRLVVSTGSAQAGAAGPRGEQVVELDRAVIVGRRPRTSTTSASGMPRLVTVSSPNQDISRSHLEVSLEEWQVLVSDLATTNGTTLMRPGQPPRRLHPNEKEIIADGDVVDLGDGVTLKFEGIW
ncbi:FHA domain-containing protein [Myceligenerans crystallogenes]|uniref:FHA domain-containing protein n=1 Tax=Myceligenerans crystallogenes TaxID=316335 RepID=A0ABP4ZBF0_9MICO